MTEREAEYYYARLRELEEDEKDAEYNQCKDGVS